jgi:hypothetical protein
MALGQISAKYVVTMGVGCNRLMIVFNGRGAVVLAVLSIRFLLPEVREMHLSQMCCDDGSWMHLAHDSIQWQVGCHISGTEYSCSTTRNL